MNHLTESQLNEYLDGELDARSLAAVEAHLVACDECRRASAGLQGLASTLEALQDEPLRRDLTPSVLAKIPQQHSRLAWKLALAAQAGIAIGMVIILLSNILAWFQPQEWLAVLFSQLTRLELPISYSPFTIPKFPAFNFQASSTNIIFLAVSALVLWGVGNAILLKNRIRASS